MPLVWLLFLGTMMVLALTGLSWLAGRLLGHHQPWPRALLAALLGSAIGNAFVTALSPRPFVWPPTSPPSYPLLRLLTALLATMGVSVFLEVLTRRDIASPGRSRRATIPHPLRALRQRIARMQRYAQIAWIAIKQGLWPYLRSRQFILTIKRPRRQHQLARSLRLALEEAGGVFVKFGQVLSTRPDLLPPDLIAELAQLQDTVAPDPYVAIKALLAEELGAAPTEVFAAFDEEPLAAASIAQVYRARLVSGETVVVKIQRPGIRALIERDLDILLRLARTAETHTLWGRELHVMVLATRFAEVVQEELDFRIEARNTVAVAAGIIKVSAVRVPAVYAQLSTSRVLVQEWLDGVSLRDAGPLLDQLGRDRAALARELFQCITHQILHDGTFHADPHPGNVLILRDGQLALIDFGMVGRLDSLQQAALRGMLVALERRHPTMLREALLDIAGVREGIDEERLERILAQLLARRFSPGMTPGAELFGDIFQLLLDFGIVFPPDISGLFRALVTLEGMLLQLAPTFRMLDETRALAAEWFKEALAPTSVGQVAVDELLAVLPSLRRLPRRLDRIATAAEQGALSVNVRLFADARDTQIVMRLVSQLVLAFLGAAIGLMAVLLLGMAGGPMVGRTMSVFGLFGYLGLVVSAVLILRVIVTIAREQAS
jgi:ubiquinone biosynthesis protein